jgi:hypothetical protein
MIIVPAHTRHQTAHSRELGRRVDDLVSEYRRDNPDATENDVRAALMRSTSFSDSADARRKRVAGVAVAAALVGAFTATASAGGKFPGGSTVTLILAIAAGVGAVAFAVVRLAQRD